MNKHDRNKHQHLDQEHDDAFDLQPDDEEIAPPDEHQVPFGGRRWERHPPAPAASDEEAGRPSKTKVKQQMHDLQELGAELVALGKDQLAQLDLPENLRDAIREMHRINKFGAQRRQMQYIGKLMREVETAPIIAKLEGWKGTSQTHVAYMHQLERWRDRLLESDSALTELLAAHPQIDVQRLRMLIRNAQKEREANKPPKNYREIFQVLREIIPEPQ
ncbi:MAG TPA: ribosome biogenesis factor YjgA [Gallionella sp.]|nr:ribosome biogenesis factor YjgA [Gallionella sp.]